MQKTWLITVCCSGFGGVLAEAVLARGDNLVATARNPGSLAGLADRYPGTVRTTTHDMTKPGEAAAAVAVAEDAFGRLDILVNNAGFGLIGRSINAAKVQLPAYAGTAGKMRAYREGDDGKQAGDPKKAVAVMLKAVSADKPPLHLPLGDRAYALARAKLAVFEGTMDTWDADAAAAGF